MKYLRPIAFGIGLAIIIDLTTAWIFFSLHDGPTFPTKKDAAPMFDILGRIGNAIWARIEPKLNERLDNIESLARDELTAWRTDSMAMLREALPEMAGAIAEQAIKTTFEHTQVDEAADAVSSVIQRIVDRIPRLPKLPWEN